MLGLEGSIYVHICEKPESKRDFLKSMTIHRANDFFLSHVTLSYYDA